MQLNVLQNVLCTLSFRSRKISNDIVSPARLLQAKPIFRIRIVLQHISISLTLALALYIVVELQVSSMNTKHLFDDEDPKVRQLSLQDRNEMSQHWAKVTFAISKRNDDGETRPRHARWRRPLAAG